MSAAYYRHVKAVLAIEGEKRRILGGLLLGRERNIYRDAFLERPTKWRTDYRCDLRSNICQEMTRSLISAFIYKRPVSRYILPAREELGHESFMNNWKRTSDGLPCGLDETRSPIQSDEVEMVGTFFSMISAYTKNLRLRLRLRVNVIETKIIQSLYGLSSRIKRISA